MNRERFNEIGKEILDAAIIVHRELGAGLLEFAYRLALKRALEFTGLSVKGEVPVALFYKDISLGNTYEIDLLVKNEVIIENKSTKARSANFTFQIITYLVSYKKILAI